MKINHTSISNHQYQTINIKSSISNHPYQIINIKASISKGPILTHCIQIILRYFINVYTLYHIILLLCGEWAKTNYNSAKKRRRLGTEHLQNTICVYTRNMMPKLLRRVVLRRSLISCSDKFRNPTQRNWTSDVGLNKHGCTLKFNSTSSTLSRCQRQGVHNQALIIVLWALTLHISAQNIANRLSCGVWLKRNNWKSNLAYIWNFRNLIYEYSFIGCQTVVRNVNLFLKLPRDYPEKRAINEQIRHFIFFHLTQIWTA